jgi:acyl-coenzyme A thioesterase PaaI-like protein
MTPHNQQHKLLQLALGACRQQRPTHITSTRHAIIPRRTLTTTPSLHDRPPFLPSQLRAVGPAPPVYFSKPPAPPLSRGRRIRRILFTATFLFLGTTLGSLIRRALIEPPLPPAPGTEEDAEEIALLREEANNLEIVQLYSNDPDWISWEAYSSLPKHQRDHHLCATTLAGVRGLGAYQRVFQHKVSGETMVVVYLGEGITGWPGVVHGGALATVLDETMGRAAFTSLNMEPGPKGSKAPPGVTANMKIDYSHMSFAGRFYVVWARVKGEHELEESERGKRDYKAYVEGVIEDEVTQRPCVYASALYVGPHKGKKEETETHTPRVMPLDKRF